MTIESFQQEITALNKRKEAAEKLLFQAQTERSVHLKTLQEEFGINVDQIDEKLKEYADTILKLEETIESKLKDLKDYVEKLEKVLKNG